MASDMLFFPSHCFVCIADSCSLLFSYCHVRNQESPLRVMLPSSRKFSNSTLFSSSVKASEQFFLQLSPHGSLKSFLFFNIVSSFLFFVSYASFTSVRFSFLHCSFPLFWVHFSCIFISSKWWYSFSTWWFWEIHKVWPDVHVEHFPLTCICQHFCDEKSYRIVYDLLSMQCAVICLLGCCFEYFNTISHQLNFVTVVERYFFSFQMRVLGKTFRWLLKHL